MTILRTLFPASTREKLRSFPPRVALLNWLRERRWKDAVHDEIYDQEYFHVEQECYWTVCRSKE
jgi:hypothetical protein